MSATTVPIDRQARISSRLDYVRPIARSLHAVCRVLPLDDLVQYGCLGLIAACDLADESRSVESFEVYCKYKIRGAILDQLRKECARRESQLVQGFDRALHTSAGQLEIAEMLNRLETRERQVIYLRLEGYTQEEIGRALNLGRSVVVRLERRAIRSLRKLSKRTTTAPERVLRAVA